MLASSPEKASSPAKERTRVKARGRKETTRALRVALELRQQCLRQHQPQPSLKLKANRLRRHGNPSVSFVTKPFLSFPSLNRFLKLSVPILATVILSITSSYEQIGEQTAASMVHPAVQNFKKYSLEFLGDNGAANDIGSFRALQGQGLSRDMVEPWIKSLECHVPREVCDRRRTATLH